MFLAISLKGVNLYVQHRLYPVNVQQFHLHPSVVGQESPDSCDTSTAGGCFDRKAYKASWYQKNRERLLQKAKIRARSRKSEKRKYDIEYRAKHFEELKQKKKVYIAKNIEEVRKRKHRYYIAHKAQSQHYNKVRAIVKRDELKKYKEHYYLNNRDRLLAKCSAYAKANPERYLAHTNKRRAYKQNASVGDTQLIIAWEKRWKSKPTATCYWCQKPFPSKPCHSDHIVPLCNGGPHSIENLCISCPSCNLRKNRSTLEDWNKRLLQPALL